MEWSSEGPPGALGPTCPPSPSSSSTAVETLECRRRRVCRRVRARARARQRVCTAVDVLLGFDVMCEVLAYYGVFPRLRDVCRRWRLLVCSEACYMHVVRGLGSPAPVPGNNSNNPAAAPWRAAWERTFHHVQWRKRPDTFMVDFPVSVIGSLANDEATLSQIYYTYPRVGLQFRRKFSLFGVQACEDLHRIALKKGVHLRSEPLLEEAEYLCTGRADGRIIKLDFASAAESGDTEIVVWTDVAIELFTYPGSTLAGEAAPRFNQALNQQERRAAYALNPLVSHARLALSPDGDAGGGDAQHALSQVLVLHINEKGIISILMASGVILQYSFRTGQRVHPPAVVPGPINVPSFSSSAASAASSPAGWLPSAAPVGGKLGWKSRERFEFKGSAAIGAVIDDRGAVHVLHVSTRAWLTVEPLHMARHAASGGRGPAPRPRYVRTAGCYAVFWNGAPSGCGRPTAGAAAAVAGEAAAAGPPFYVEAWKCTEVRGVLRGTRVMCECYSASSSVHVDDSRVYVSASVDRRDVFIDVWSLSTGTFVSRIHAVNNSWSLEKAHLRTHLSKLFYSSPDAVIYYELNTNQDGSDTLCIRQLSSVPRQAYWDACAALKGDSALNHEAHEVTTERPVQSAIHEVWPHVPVAGSFGGEEETVMVNTPGSLA